MKVVNRQAFITLGNHCISLPDCPPETSFERERTGSERRAATDCSALAETTKHRDRELKARVKTLNLRQQSEKPRTRAFGLRHLGHLQPDAALKALNSPTRPQSLEISFSFALKPSPSVHHLLRMMKHCRVKEK